LAQSKVLRQYLDTFELIIIILNHQHWPFYTQNTTFSRHTKISFSYFLTLFGTTFSNLLIIKVLNCFYQIIKKGLVEIDFSVGKKFYCTSGIIWLL